MQSRHWRVLAFLLVVLFSPTANGEPLELKGLGVSVAVSSDWRIDRASNYEDQLSLYHRATAVELKLSRRPQSGHSCASFIGMGADSAGKTTRDASREIPAPWYSKTYRPAVNDAWDGEMLCLSVGNELVVGQVAYSLNGRRSIQPQLVELLEAIAEALGAKRGPYKLSALGVTLDANAIAGAWTAKRFPFGDQSAHAMNPVSHSHALEVTLWRERGSSRSCAERLEPAGSEGYAQSDVSSLVGSRWHKWGYQKNLSSAAGRVYLCLPVRDGFVMSIVNYVRPAILPELRPRVRGLLSVIQERFPERRAEPALGRSTAHGSAQRSPRPQATLAPRRSTSRDLRYSSWSSRGRTSRVPAGQIILGGSIVSLTGLSSTIAIASDSSTMKVVVGSLVATSLLIATLRRVVQRADMRSRTRPERGMFLGDDDWLSSASSQLGLLMGGASMTTGDMATDSEVSHSMALVGAQAVIRAPLVRASWQAAYGFGLSSEDGFSGLDTSFGLGIQFFRGGLFSPYGEVRYSFFPNTIDEQNSLADAAEGSDGSEIVIGNTFMFSGLGYRGHPHRRGTLLMAEPNASRFVVDVAYVVDGRDLFGRRLMVTLGFDHAWWR